MSSKHVNTTLRDTFFTDPFFRDTFDDFSQLYRAMMDESREFWVKEEEQRKSQIKHQEQYHGTPVIEEGGGGGRKTSLVESTTAAAAAPIASSSKPEDYASWFFPRRWLLPRLFGGEQKHHLISNEEKKTGDLMHILGDDNALRLTNNDKKFEVSLDTHGYKPEEVKVNVEGNKLVVEGRHEVKEDDQYVYRHFKRAYAIPKECDVDHVVSNLSSDGVLMITAPKMGAIGCD